MATTYDKGRGQPRIVKNMRLRKSLADRVQARADENDRSFTAEVSFLLEYSLWFLRSARGHQVPEELRETLEADQEETRGE